MKIPVFATEQEARDSLSYEEIGYAVDTGKLVYRSTPTDAIAFNPPGEQGDQGDPGVPGLTWRSAWSSVTAYAVGDAVSNGGSSYIAILVSTDIEPGVDSGWELKWDLLAAKGADGV